MRFAVSAFITYVVSRLRSHNSLCLENIALRHQLFVYQRTVKRPTLHTSDRLFWVWLSRLWPGWHDALEFVQPRTVLAWQKQRFRDYWRRVSQSGKPGRPSIAKEIRDLIRDMWRSKPCSSILYRVLSHLAYASIAGDGCARATSDPATQARTSQETA